MTLFTKIFRKIKKRHPFLRSSNPGKSSLRCDLYGGGKYLKGKEIFPFPSNIFLPRRGRTAIEEKVEGEAKKIKEEYECI